MAVRTVVLDDPQQQLADAERAWNEVRRAPSSSPADVRNAAAALIIAARLNGRYREALHVGKDAETLLGEKAPHELAFIEAHVCLAVLDQGEVVEASKWIERARTRPRRKGDDVTGAALARAEGNLHLTARRWREAKTAFEEHARLATDPLEKTIGNYNVGEACIRLGLFDEARTFFDAIIPVKEGLHDRWGLAYSHWGRGICWLNQAQPDVAQALSDASQGLGYAKQMADPKIGSRLRTLHARCLLAQEKLAEADSAARDAVREAARAGPRERADAQLALAEVLCAGGQGRRASSASEVALEIATKASLEDLMDAARAVSARAASIA